MLRKTLRKSQEISPPLRYYVEKIETHVKKWFSDKENRV